MYPPRAIDGHEASAFKSAGLARERARRVIQHVYAHYQESLPVEQLAALVHQSPFHFSRMFKRATAVSPHWFVTMVRIEKARELLVETSLSCRDVGAASGFATHAHFTGVFKSWVGISPQRFRRLILAPRCERPTSQGAASIASRSRVRREDRSGGRAAG